MNNPLKYTDPSGYRWRSWADHWVPTIVIAVVGIVVTICTYGAAAPAAAEATAAITVASAMVSGFVTGALTAYIYGASLGECLEAGMQGMVISGLTSVATLGIGSLISKIPISAHFNWGNSVYTSNSELVKSEGWSLFSHGVYRSLGDVTNSFAGSTAGSSIANGIISNTSSATLSGMFTSASLTASLDGMIGLENSSINFGNQSELGNSDTSVRIINFSDKTVYFKPEDDITINGITYKGDGAYPVDPYKSSFVPIDGVNVNGVVTKVSDGYNYIVIHPDGNVETFYKNPFNWSINKVKGGVLATPPGDNWKNLFNAIKL